jgi:DNA polymerase-1
LREEKPEYIAAIFESREKTFRHETFADYKANRLAMPDDLASQMPYIFRLCEVLNIPVINVPGYEADDVIGALAYRCRRRVCRRSSFRTTKTCASSCAIR